MHISKVSKSFNEEVSFLFNDDNIFSHYFIESGIFDIIKNKFV